ncbi:MAG: endonuclease domain-containing protein [Alphaproteobacteria bacterium]|nr:endonuclease domain-containing protein [Alphaproteobacteria bacterium]
MARNDGPFHFDSYAFQEETGALHLHYSFEDGPAFEEKIVFPPAARALSKDEEAALESSFRLIFLLAGISYYKACVPERLVCRAFALDEKTEAFLEKVYRNGLGEFAYRNKLDLSNRIRFDTEKTEAWKAAPLKPSSRLLVPVGGGKDSIVTLEGLQKAGEDVTLFALGGTAGLAEPIRATIEASGLPSLRVERTLSPKLMELNRAGALNGHVPITAILSAIAVACAILHGHGAVVMSNEHSASEPNLRMGNLEINHQYSKSLAFEKDLAAFIHEHIAPGLGYFSFLRPLTEAAIARRFAKLEKYHAVFRSCNTAFRQDAALRGKNWCCDCPKCRFVFLALAPFMDKAKLTAIFGKNLLADEAQKEGFAELCGLSSHKPFECVGEIGESALLMEKLAHSDEWKNDIVVKALSGRLSKANDFEQRFNALFGLKDGHQVPDKYLEMLRACA